MCDNKERGMSLKNSFPEKDTEDACWKGELGTDFQGLCTSRRELEIHYTHISIVLRCSLPHQCLLTDPLLWSRVSWKQQRCQSTEKASRQQRRSSIVPQESNQVPILMKYILH